MSLHTREKSSHNEDANSLYLDVQRRPRTRAERDAVTDGNFMFNSCRISPRHRLPTCALPILLLLLLAACAADIHVHARGNFSAHHPAHPATHAPQARTLDVHLPSPHALDLRPLDVHMLDARMSNAAVAGFALLFDVGDVPPLSSFGALAVLGLGLAFGLKHATEADHVVAVSTIVSEHGSLLRAALVGALWGAGHTAALLCVGVVVLALRVSISERVGTWMEFAVGLMIIGLGVNVLVRALRGRARVHLHEHRHDGVTHAHLHFHERETQHAATKTAATTHSHAVAEIGFKPLIVGAAHGLAGSATLTLLVLTQIKSALLGMLYLSVFGVGSICGMLLMSGLIGLPFALTSRRVSGVNYGLQTVTGALSIAFGLWYAAESGILKLF
jgi:ABC-type nickel/cobalt efflux system permease component RcnA